MPAYTMNGRNYMPVDSTLKPGPGQHSPEKVRKYWMIQGTTKDLLYGKRICMVRSECQSERKIRIILPARRASHNNFHSNM